MSYNQVPAGNNIPNDIFVVIEIPSNTLLVKYEFHHKYNVFFVDRFLNVSLAYPCNYGYINNTLSLDGDPLDVLVVTSLPLIQGVVIQSRPIGVLKMVDEQGVDHKILAVPHTSISTEYDSINNIHDISSYFLDKISNFFKQYKCLSKVKWSKIDGWYGVDVAKKLIIDSIIHKRSVNIN